MYAALATRLSYAYAHGIGVHRVSFVTFSPRAFVTDSEGILQTGLGQATIEANNACILRPSINSF